MKTMRNATILDCIVYCIAMAAANVAGTVALILMLYLFKITIGQAAASEHYVSITIISSVIAVAVSALLIYLYFRYKIPDITPKITEEYDSVHTMRSNFWFMVLPAEILRMVLHLLPLAPGRQFLYRFADGFFAFVPNFLFDQFYMSPNSLHERIREYGYTLTDNAVFAGIYILYFLLTITVLYFVFAFAWKRYEEARKNEVRIRMDPEQMK